MNAAERCFAASRAHDADAGAAVAELAAAVVMLKPANDDPIVGKAAVAGALHRRSDGARRPHGFRAGVVGVTPDGFTRRENHDLGQ